MVHYYYYVSAGRQCDAQTKIFKVAVGTSTQQALDLRYELYAKEIDEHNSRADRYHDAKQLTFNF